MPNCPACGADTTDEQVFCTSCGARLAPAPPVPPLPPLPAAPAIAPGGTSTPVSVASVSASSTSPVYASLGRRALAALLDVVPFLAFCWIFLALAAARHGGWTPDGTYALEPFPAFGAIGKAATAWLVYLACFEWWFCGSLGKWALGMRVTGLDGKRPSAIQSVTRNLLRVLDGIVLYLVGAIFLLLTKRRQRLGDLIARTVVVVPRSAVFAKAAALATLLVLPFAAYGATWYAGLLRTASGRWISEPTTRLHGEGKYSTGLQGSIDIGTGKSTVHRVREGYASGSVIDETLIMDSLRFAAGMDGAERRGGVFKPGETAVLLFNLAGMRASQGSTSGRIRMKLRVLDPGGADLVSAVAREDEVAAGPTRVVSRDIAIALPASCPPGSCRFELQVDDLLALHGLKATIPFTVAQ